MNRTSRLCLLSLVVALGAACVAPTFADDRRLISGFEELPTVFFLFDTSGSMHWSAQCTQEDFDAGECDLLCPLGSCWAPGAGDSPNSKLFQAKQAVYEVIDQTDDIQVGFATFNQDDLRLRRKHWLYEALEDGPNIPGYGPYPRGRDTSGPDPVQGDLHTFGATWGCFVGPDPDDDTGCAAATPANLNLRWDRERMQAWPKHTPDLNGDANAFRTFFVAFGGETYEMRFGALTSNSTTLGAPTIEMQVRRRRCADIDCTTFDQVETREVDFGYVTDFDNWDINTDRTDFQPGFFAQGTVSDGPAGNTCVNWDANTDTVADTWDGYNIRWPTVPDVDFPGLLDVGDVLPIDWRNDNRQALLERLAPNLALDPNANPDFRVATYFEDIVNPADELRLKDEAARPILSFGATPIGTSLRSFHDFMAGSTGWVNVAQNSDPSTFCRRTYLIVLSDGNQSTCDGDDPCDTQGTKELFESLGVPTFVVAFGVAPHRPYLPRCSGDPDEEPGVNCCPSDTDPSCIPSDTVGLPVDEWPPTGPGRENRSLRCMASTGGTGNEDYDLDGSIDSDGPGVIYPQNKDELVDALISILDQIKPAPSAFATAAVPSVQAEAADKVFLSEFTPVPQRSNWIGRVNAFLKPVPVDEFNRPDTSIPCPPDPDPTDPTDDPSACLLWEAGQVILDNQYNEADPVGELANQRRIFYGEFGDRVPRKRHFFEETQDGTTPLAQEFDLWRGFDIPFDPLLTPTHDLARTRANNVIGETLEKKTTPQNDDFPTPIDYLLTDIFHSDPLFFTSPNNLLYFLQDLDGYREFSILHAFRRRVLLFGANGGMLHGLDAGVCREVSGDPRPCIYDNGSGRELFAVVPRQAMPTVRDLTEGLPRHRYSVDGRTQAADVFIDPIHEGTDSTLDPPREDDREWRTVLIGGLREGGHVPPEGIGDLSSPLDSNPLDTEDPRNHPTSGYYVIDVTQPDPLPAVAPGVSPIPEVTGLEPPGCLRSIDGITPAEDGCGPIAFGSILWEFSDSIDGVRLDEDDNGYVDLAFAWSNPNVGRIQVCTSGCTGADPQLEDRYVLIVGGGYDPRAEFQRGNFLYMIDVETGDPIYKFPVMGAVAAEPAAVDTNFDGYIDTVYFGTTLGLLYRTVLFPIDDGGPDLKYPFAELHLVQEVAADGTVVSKLQRRILDTDFAPFVLLETTAPGTIPPEVRPIFYPPSVIFLSEFNKYAIAVGTGERENIFRRQQPSGRFFTFVDNVGQTTIMDPTFEPFSPASTDLEPLTPTSATFGSTNLLLPGEGWWLELAADERLVTEPFALSGILFFSTFIPNPDGPIVIPEESLCRESGTSNIYGVFTTNADGLLSDDPDINSANDLERFVTVEGLVSSPFTEQAQTKNPAPEAGTDVIDTLDNRLRFIRDRLKENFPANCSFPPGYRIDVKTRNSGTGIDFIAPVPICVVEKNFRDF